MPKKALITGLNGFAGNHLAKVLLEKDYVVVGVDTNIEPGGKLDYNTNENIKLVKADIRDEHKIEELLVGKDYDEVYHLAAQSSVKLSFENPVETLSINVNGTLNILETISKMEKPPKTLVISSSEIYGQLKPDQVPVIEDSPLMPVNPYAVSKATVDLMSYQYYKAYNLPIYWARAFSHSGPGQKTVAVLSDWCFQAASIELGLRQPEIGVGNMDVTRDYTDVRDVVRAYIAILENGQPGKAYNVCSGKGYRLDDLLNIIVSFSSKKITIMPDPSRLRPVDIPILIGSPKRLMTDTGWKAETGIEQTMKDLFDYWIEYLTPQIENG